MPLLTGLPPGRPGCREQRGSSCSSGGRGTGGGGQPGARQVPGRPRPLCIPVGVRSYVYIDANGPEAYLQPEGGRASPVF